MIMTPAIMIPISKVRKIKMSSNSAGGSKFKRFFIVIFPLNTLCCTYFLETFRQKLVQIIMTLAIMIPIRMVRKIMNVLLIVTFPCRIILETLGNIQFNGDDLSNLDHHQEGQDDQESSRRFLMIIFPLSQNVFFCWKF